MSNENHIEPTNAPTTKSGKSAPNEAGETNWEEHKAQRKLAKKAEKKSFSRPVAAIVAVVAVCASVAIASGFVGLIENGNQLPQTLQLAQVNAQADVTRTQVVLDSSDNETATVVWSRNVDTAAIIVEGLAKLDDDTYRVWYEAAGEYTAVGELSVTHDGSEVWAMLTGDIGSAQSVIVTIDSADATEPGSDIVAEIEL
ncbi:anti-sigma factor domain-containing protein [Paramicrobacterium chengjingii]|uniref:Anti-sigma factor n=1 Tax=Paramicrobacterium chengjingii TaxID=2769067 RepID=A0ABX6YF46_9MICO|nr:anti-sigma factor [Microbacterium chengjingii]QPZ37392.1 anti-sigma factor [Microbacterium chengjingii]